MANQQRNCNSRQTSGCGRNESQSVSYKCASCGLINESSTGSAPESCSKCECGKFYKV